MSVITSGGVDVRTPASALADRVDGEVRFDDGTRATYSTDASNYRQEPIGFVVPHTIDAAVEAIAVCREHSAPVLSRGGGTSLAGECTNHAVVIDWSKYCNRVLSVDADARTATVEPGIALDDLNAVLAAHGQLDVSAAAARPCAWTDRDGSPSVCRRRRSRPRSHPTAYGRGADVE